VISISRIAPNIFQVLADLPDFLREPILRKKLREFYTSDESGKRETISAAVNATSCIEAGKLRALLKTWLEILSEFDADEVVMIFRMYCEEFLKHPEGIENLKTPWFVHALLTLEENKKQKLTDCLIEATFIVPNRHKIIKLMPNIIAEVFEKNS
jgi:hypothetical protein